MKKIILSVVKIITFLQLTFLVCLGCNLKKNYEPAMMSMNDEYLCTILKKNQDKLFVKRILQPDKYQTLDLGNGQTASHLMAYGEADGKYFVFPTVMMDNGKLKQFDTNEAWKRAHKTNNVIIFESETEASWFSKEYKRYWLKTDNNWIQNKNE